MFSVSDSDTARTRRYLPRSPGFAGGYLELISAHRASPVTISAPICPTGAAGVHLSLDRASICSAGDRLGLDRPRSAPSSPPVPPVIISERAGARSPSSPRSPSHDLIRAHALLRDHLRTSQGSISFEPTISESTISFEPTRSPLACSASTAPRKTRSASRILCVSCNGTSRGDSSSHAAASNPSLG